MVHTTPTLRELQAQERAERILDAAARIFARKGYHRATTREIATEAGVAEGTIYNHFASKRDLLLAMMTRLAEINDLRQAITQAPVTDDREFFRQLFRRRIDLLVRNIDLIQAVLPEILVDPELRASFFNQFIGGVIEPFHNLWAARMALGTVRPFDPDVVIRAVMGMFFGLMLFEMAGQPLISRDPDHVAGELVNLLFDGLGPPREVRR